MLRVPQSHLPMSLIKTALVPTLTLGAPLVTGLQVDIIAYSCRPEPFECHHPNNSLSSECSTHQIHLSSFETRLSCGSVSNALHSPGRWCQSLCPHLPALSPCHTRPPNLSGMICLQKSDVGCHKSPLSTVSIRIFSMILPDTSVTDWPVVCCLISHLKN